MSQDREDSVASAAYIELNGVSKSFDGKRSAVADLNLAIRRGEFLTLLGPSGSGKTTLLMMLAGFESPTTGQIRVDGRAISHLPAHKRNIGVVFQSYALFPHMTVAQNIAFPLSVRNVGRDEQRERVARALQLMRMPDLAERRPEQLSGGQQQRVALARALVFDPDLILMDEPLGALDKQLRDQLQHEIKQVQRKLEVTVVYVTHDQSEALTMSDRIAVFKDGVIQQLGTPEEVYERPNSTFVAEFVGESNRLEGVIVATHADHWVVRIDNHTCVHARAASPGAAGERVLLSIRPERILVSPPGNVPTNCFDAVIDQVVYQGDHIRVQARLLRGCNLVIRIASGARQASFRTGDQLRIAWNVNDCRAYSTGERAPLEAQSCEQSVSQPRRAQ
jgi:putative spermidine/putrescine transport system ATP-binding protein